MRDLSRTQKEIINYLIAENEGTHSFGKAGIYMRAFRGIFRAEMPFTFYFLSETRPIMYVYDPRPADKRSSREVFHHECNHKKQKILEITGFFEDLTEAGYVRRIYRGLQGRMELPEHYDRVWRKYSDFYSNIMAGLAFVGLADFTPKLKLYKLWRTLKPALVQAGPREGDPMRHLS
ncbi:MAG: hypothetical protein LBU25_09840 [Treponema sp.]|jgi:hypothetical protein|nr:hypothetical protein [Treponema sp.]